MLTKGNCSTATALGTRTGIETVRDEFLAQGERPTRSQFMCRAGLNNKVKQSADVQAAIEDALRRLADTVPFKRRLGE